jgi:hypothetical protein
MDSQLRVPSVTREPYCIEIFGYDDPCDMPISFSSEIAAAIEQLYTAFQGYPLPATTYPCLCCHSVGAERPLYSRPLRKLRQEDLKQYAGDALLVWGGVDEFRHFLPRIFEIYAFVDGFSFPGREIVFAKLSYGEWRTWPQKEQEAVQGFLLALWRAALNEPPTDDLLIPPEVELWLCVLAQTDTGLSLYCREWLAHPSPNAVWNLAAIIYRTGMPRADSRVISAFWREHMDEAKQVADWLHSEAVQRALERAVDVYVNEPFAEELVAAANIIS